MKVQIMSQRAMSYLIKNRERVCEYMNKNKDNFNFFEEENVFTRNEIYLPSDYNIDLDAIDITSDDVNGVLLKPSASIRLYNEIKKLPQAIITHRGFWLWLMFEYYYEICISMTKESRESALKDNWMLKAGEYHHRNLMFGILSRNYFAVEMTVDKRSENPYYITEWALEKLERFRNFTFRTLSNNNKINLCGFKAILKLKKYYDNLDRDIEKKKDMNGIKFFPLVSKELNAMGSVKLIDFIDDEKFVEELTKRVINKIDN